MVRPYLVDLAGMIPAINDVFIYKGMIDAFRFLPNRKYDIAIDMLCDYKLEPAVTALLSKAPVRVGFKGGFREILFTHAVDDWKGSSKSMVDIDLELLRPLNIVPQVKIPKLTRVGRVDSDKIIIAIHPGGYYDSQKWGYDRFTSLAKMITEAYDARVIVVDEKALPSLKGFVELLSGCSLLVCNNSGPLHLAAALGVPTVSIMGPTDPSLWWPKGDNQVVIRKGVKCSPCSLGKCRKHLCMDLITVDEVFGEVRKLLGKVYGVKK
jgi:heptosyltransferase-2